MEVVKSIEKDAYAREWRKESPQTCSLEGKSRAERFVQKERGLSTVRES